MRKKPRQVTEPPQATNDLLIRGGAIYIFRYANLSPFCVAACPQEKQRRDREKRFGLCAAQAELLCTTGH
jgi:hypothetical protein